MMGRMMGSHEYLYFSLNFKYRMLPAEAPRDKTERFVTVQFFFFSFGFGKPHFSANLIRRSCQVLAERRFLFTQTRTLCRQPLQPV